MLHHKTFIETAEKRFETNGMTDHYYAVYFDIAEFKMVNHYYGTLQGDRLLMAVEEHLEKIPEIIVYERMFSDQFAFLMAYGEELTEKELQEKFKDYTGGFLAEQQKNFPACALKISCGIFRMDNHDLREAIDGANQARKLAKKKGSEEAVIFDGTSFRKILEYHELELEIHQALKEKRFMFYLQPKVNLLTGLIIGAEALARYIQPGGEILTGEKTEFVWNIMEENGSIVQMDMLIFEEVCKYLSERIQAGLPVVRTSVNLSRLHIQKPSTAATLHRIAQGYKIPPELLEFELTERILLNEFSGAKAFIDELRGYNYRVSIDDFGSGYAGINIWQQLSFDTLKLDKIFLSEEEEYKSRNAAIVPNVINIAQRLNIEVICEGVEREDQCRYLLRLGCTAVQGYYFDRPMPPEKFYKTYQEKEEFYPVPFIKDNGHTHGKAQVKEKEIDSFRTLKYSSIAVCGALFLILSTVLVMLANPNLSPKIFKSTLTGASFVLMAVSAICLIIYRYLRRWQKQLHINEMRYRMLEQFADTVLFNYDSAEDCLRFTPNVTAFCRCSGLTIPNFSKVLEESENIYLGDHQQIFQIIGNNSQTKPEIRVRLKHPEEEGFFWCMVQYKYIYDKERVVSIIGKIVNIDDQYKHEQMMVQRSTTDGLTGLLNRPVMEERISRHLREDSTGALLMIDADDFKSVNDIYGHDAGDKALCYIADCIKSIFRSEDAIGRFGGDEFVVYLNGSTDREMLRYRLKCLSERIGKAESIYGFTLSLSIGIACYPTDGEDYKSLLLAADKAMYEAKHGGKQRYSFYDEIEEGE